MATGTKARGWPLMANCILHSSFVNCCLPSSHFLLGHGTKPRTGGLEMAHQLPTQCQALSTSTAPSLHSLLCPLSSLSPQSRASFYLLTGHTPMTSTLLSLCLPFFSPDMRSSLVLCHIFGTFQKLVFSPPPASVESR